MINAFRINFFLPHLGFIPILSVYRLSVTIIFSLIIPTPTMCLHMYAFLRIGQVQVGLIQLGKWKLITHNLDLLAE